MSLLCPGLLLPLGFVCGDVGKEPWVCLTTPRLWPYWVPSFPGLWPLLAYSTLFQSSHLCFLTSGVGTIASKEGGTTSLGCPLFCLLWFFHSWCSLSLLPQPLSSLCPSILFLGDCTLTPYFCKHIHPWSPYLSSQHLLPQAHTATSYQNVADPWILHSPQKLLLRMFPVSPKVPPFFQACLRAPGGAGLPSPSCTALRRLLLVQQALSYSFCCPALQATSWQIRIFCFLAWPQSCLLIIARFHSVWLHQWPRALFQNLVRCPLQTSRKGEARIAPGLPCQVWGAAEMRGWGRAVHANKGRGHGDLGMTS